MNKHKQFIKDAYNGEFGSMCSEWKETILKSYPEFEEGEFKVGDWIIGKDGFSPITPVKILKKDNYNHFSKNGDSTINDFVSDKYVGKATKEEIEKHLIEEAKRRGFKEGVNYYSVITGNEVNKILSNLKYYERTDNLTDGCGGSVYLKGKWANIIETITKEEAEKKLNCKII